MPTKSAALVDYGKMRDVPRCAIRQLILADQWTGSNQAERTLRFKVGWQEEGLTHGHA